jgi:dienelactone hydrolase
MSLVAESVQIDTGLFQLQGDLVVPESARGIVLFAHGSGSSRFSPRNQHVASILQQRNLGTLLFDLLTEEEEILDSQTREYRFDIDLLTTRLVSATDWTVKNDVLCKMRIGYFGASTGAAAAIKAAALRPDQVDAVVSRGGRPDLAGDALQHLKAPTLFIVGEQDYQVIQLNVQAMKKIRGEKSLQIIPGATHLFEEPGTLDSVSNAAASWFKRFLK